MRSDGRGLGAVFLGGSAGALARVWLSDALTHHPGSWPWSTLVINVAGTLLLGALAGRRLTGRSIGFAQQPLLEVGFCGALTTFSTFQLELLQMLDDGRAGLAAAYVAVSIAAGLGALALTGPHRAITRDPSA